MNRLKSPFLPVDVFGESKILFEVFRACCEPGVGYTGGDVSNATYRNHGEPCGGD